MGVNRIGVKSAEELKPQQILDLVFADASTGFEVAPQNVRLTAKPKTLTGTAGETYRVLSTRFSKVAYSGAESQSRGLLSAVVVAGDLFLLVTTCREATWERSEQRLTQAVESFRAVPNQ